MTAGSQPQVMYTQTDFRVHRLPFRRVRSNVEIESTSARVTRVGASDLLAMLGPADEPYSRRLGRVAAVIWATLAFLGVPIWLVLGALLGASLSRHRFRSQPDVIPLLFRSANDDKWPKRLAYGRYIHDVLIVNHGLAQIRTSVHVVEDTNSLDLSDTTFKHIEDPIGFAIRLDDGSDYELVLDRSDNPVPVHGWIRG